MSLNTEILLMTKIEFKNVPSKFENVIKNKMKLKGSQN